MTLFGKDHSEEELNIIEHQAREISKLTDLLGRLIPIPKPAAHGVHLVLKQKLNNNSIVSIMSLSLASNQKSLGTLGLVDQVTQAAVTGTFTGSTATSDTPAAFTATSDDSGNIVVTAVAVGSGNLNVATTAAYTDSTGAAQSVPLTAVVPVSVTAVVTADAVSLVVNFGAPVAQ